MIIHQTNRIKHSVMITKGNNSLIGIIVLAILFSPIKLLAQPCASINTITCGNSIKIDFGSGLGDPNFPNGVGTSNYYNSGNGGLEKIYKFVAPSTGLYQINTTSAISNGTRVEYFWKYAVNGCSNSGWQGLGYTSSISPLSALSLTTGDSILLLVNSESTSALSQSFQINCALPLPCNNISSVSCGSTIDFITTTGYGDPNFSNGLGTSNYYNPGNGGLEKIYKFVAPSTGLYQINTSSASSNGSRVEYFWKYAVNGCSNTGWQGLGYTSSISPLSALTLSTGDSILLLVNSETTSATSQSFQINCALPLPCSNISTVNCGSTIDFITTSGYGDPNFQNGVGTSNYYNSGNGGLEKIYKFVAPSTGLYQINTTSESTQGSRVEYFWKYAVNGCSNTGWQGLGYTSIISPISALSLTTGDSILLLVNSESTSATSQTFQISCATPLPCDDITSINCGDTIAFKVGVGYGHPDYYNGVGTGCYKNTGRGGVEKIYRFVAPLTGYYRLETTSPALFSSYVGYFYRKSNNCGGNGWNCFGYTWTITKLDSVFLNYNDTLLVLVKPESVGGISQNFKLNCATTVCNIVPVTKNTSLSGCGSVVYNGKTYTSNTIVRDTVKSKYGCDSVYNVVTVAVTTAATPTIKITASQTSFTPGTLVRIDATVTNEGTDPIYHWKNNGTDITYGNSISFPNLANGDSVWCVLTSNLTCVSAANAMSNKIIFKTINAIPSITSFYPTKAKVGDTVSIKGLNFRDTVINRTIYFGAVKAKIIKTTDTLIKVIVPVGASYSPISIYIDGLSATSLLPFSTLFSAAKSFQPYSFEPPIDSIYGNDISAIASGDFDGDGKIDFLELGNTSIYCNRNISTPKKIAFAAKQKLLDWGAIKWAISNPIIEDLDGDGKKDIAFAATSTTYTASSIYYLKNKSTGSQILFDTAVFLASTSGGKTNSFAVGDIDLDGRPDIAINRQGYVDILRNTTVNGKISFQTLQYVISPPGYPLNQIKMADMNNDGKPDLVILDVDTRKTKVYINNCSIGVINKFSLQETKSDYDFLSIGDFNNDNKLDIATTTGGRLIALKNQGLDLYSLAFDTTQFISGIISSAIETTDFNGDGYPDVAISGYVNGYKAGVCLMENQQKANSIIFSNPQSFLFDTTITTNVQITVADFDGDGIPDIAFGNSNNKTLGKVSFLRNRINTMSITNFSPSISTVGTTITIKGYQFSEVTAVRFGGVPAASFTVLNDTTITAIVGNGGTGTVALTSPYSTVANIGFAFCATPVSKNLTINGCNSVLYKGVTYLNNTSFKDTLKNANGCDSIFYTINISINKITPTTISNTLSGCSSVSFNGKVYTNNTTVRDTVKNIFGCDSVYNVVTITVTTAATPTIKITASQTSFIPGNQVRLDAIVTNEGTSPVYQWKKNGIASGTTIWISSTSFSNNDTIWCELTSNLSCVSASNVVSNKIILKTINAIPSITSFYPIKAKVGDTISIKGLNFRDTVINRTIYFGGVKAKIITTSDTLIKVIVPVGASYSPISICIDGLIANSTLPFSTLFPAAKSFQPYSFEPPIDSIYGNNINAIASSDFDGDGKIDFVEIGNTTLYCNRNISTPKKIAFAPKQKLVEWGVSAKLTMNNPIIEDIDGDGKKDILVGIISNQTTASAIYYLKNTSTVSDIKFSSPISVVDMASNQNSFAVGDIDLDGRPDIVINRLGYVDILRNTIVNGNFSFQIVQNVISSTGNPLNQLKIADMNGDGKPDLVILDVDTHQTKVYINNCSIGVVNKFALHETKSNYNYLSVGDFNNDNKLDVITTNWDDLISLKNTSTDSNSLSFDTTNYISGIISSGIETTDFNGDGYPDLAIPGYYQAKTGACLVNNQKNEKSISFSNPQAYITDTTIASNAIITVADFDGDGIPDIAIGNSNNKTSGKVSFLRNRINTITITAFSPAIGTVGTTVTIKGYQLSEVTAVTFGGVPAASFKVLNDTTITAIVGNGGTGSVSITSPYSTVANNGFVFCATPVSKNLTLNGCNSVLYKGVTYTNSTSFKDTLRNANGCDSIYNNINISIININPISKSTTLSGSDSVTYNGKVYTVNTVVKDTVKSVQGCDSIYNTTTIIVNVIAKLSINEFLPTQASTGTKVTIKGKKLIGVTSVTFGGTEAASFSVINDSVIVAVVGSGTTGSVKIESGIGKDSLSGFTFIATQVKSLFIVGSATASGWTNLLSPSDSIAQRFTSTGDTTFKISLHLKGGAEYKFITKNGSWDNSFGIALKDDPSMVNSGILVSNGNNILSPSLSGNYSINVNTNTRKYSVTLISPDTLYIIGNATLGGWQNPLMEFDRINQQFERISDSEFSLNIFLTGDSSYKLIARNGDWTYNWGIAVDNDPNMTLGGKLIYGASSKNILAPQISGIYTINVNFATGVYSLISVLPVNITSFSTIAKKNAVIMNWNTSTELNTSSFEVQHSLDGVNFASIGVMKAIGSGANSYQFTDKNPANGINYYRLKSIDKDGVNSYTKVASVIYKAELASFSIYPTIVSNGLVNIKIDNSLCEKVEIGIIDLNGKILQSETIALGSVTNVIPYKIKNLSKGIYFLRISDSINVKTFKFVME